VIIIDDDDDVGVLPPTADCPGGIITIDLLPVLCLSLLGDDPLGGGGLDDLLAALGDLGTLIQDLLDALGGGLALPI
jgi:hypothetical protein